MKFSNTIKEFHELVNNRVVPGVHYAILQSEDSIEDTFGEQEIIPDHEALTANQLYDLASLTKVIGTMPVILQLVEEGKLSLSDSISRYLPEWRFPEVTINNLLTHTSGIEGYIPHRNALNSDQLKKALLGLHVGKNFNAKMVYTDTNYIFLGLIAQRLTGQPIQDLIQERILTPLKMQKSTFKPVDPNDCVPTDYTNGKLRRGTVEDPKAQILGSECGSAGLFSSMSDLKKFVNEMLLPTGKILRSQTVHSLFTDHTINGKLGRSFGWQYHSSPEYLFQAGYTGTGIILQPQKKHGLIFLTNRVHPTAPNEAYIPKRDHLIQTFIHED